MNRIIKFRAWVKGQGGKYSFDGYKMLYPELDLFGIKNHYDDKNRFMFSDGEVDGHFSISEVVMQFTGLKDKNGKDIYEGDIAKWHTKNTDEIIFDEKMAGFFTKKHPIFENEKTGITLGQLNLEVLEVIGNIYENPELLNVK